VVAHINSLLRPLFSANISDTRSALWPNALRTAHTTAMLALTGALFIISASEK
jgi:hypothetical protein